MRRRQFDIAFLPPVQLGHVLDPRTSKPGLVAEGSKKVAIRMAFRYLFHCRIRQVIIVVMGYHHRVDGGNILDCARHLGVALRT